jgi:hypothetical protein
VKWTPSGTQLKNKIPVLERSFKRIGWQTIVNPGNSDTDVPHLGADQTIHHQQHLLTVLRKADPERHIRKRKGFSTDMPRYSVTIRPYFTHLR